MKKIFIAFSLLFIIACSKETETPNPLLGTWALVDFTAIYTSTGNKTTASTDVETWTFQDYGSAYVNGGTPIQYTLDGKYLSMTYVTTGVHNTYFIEVLTESTLKVYWKFPRNEHQEEMDLWYTFTKMK